MANPDDKFFFFSFGLLGVCMMFLQKAGATCSPKSLEKNLSCNVESLASEWPYFIFAAVILLLNTSLLINRALKQTSFDIPWAW